MGLDITAYSKVEKLDANVNDNGYPVSNTTDEEVDYSCVAYVNEHFPHRADDIEDGAVYDCDDSFGFRAGSYSGYSGWREELAKLAGYPAASIERYGEQRFRHDVGAWAASDGPFWEMIMFSDCEGVIGTSVCSKLAKDFADFDGRAKNIGNEWFYNLYQQWHKAFELASNNGFVDFH